MGYKTAFNNCLNVRPDLCTEINHLYIEVSYDYMSEDHNNTQASTLPNTATKPLEFVIISDLDMQKNLQ